jgi:quercetin dioxygenase-like cupin family protein
MSYTIIPFEAAEKVPFNLDGKILFKGNRCELVHLTLQPGETLGLHDQPYDVIFHVLSGEGVLIAGDEEIRAVASTTIEMKTGTRRGWKNTGGDKLKLLVIKLITSS